MRAPRELYVRRTPAPDLRPRNRPVEGGVAQSATRRRPADMSACLRRTAAGRPPARGVPPAAPPVVARAPSLARGPRGEGAPAAPTPGGKAWARETSPGRVGGEKASRVEGRVGAAPPSVGAPRGGAGGRGAGAGRRWGCAPGRANPRGPGAAPAALAKVGGRHRSGGGARRAGVWAGFAPGRFCALRVCCHGGSPDAIAPKGSALPKASKTAKGHALTEHLFSSLGPCGIYKQLPYL